MNTYQIQIDEEQRQILLKVLAYYVINETASAKTRYLLTDFTALPADQAASPCKVISFCE